MADNVDFNTNVRRYCNEIGGELLTPEEEEKLFYNLEECQELLVKTKLTHECPKCAAVKKEITEKNLRYVVHIAKQYLNRGPELDDLIQEGNLGLIRAIAKFDVRKGFRFTTYSTWWIRQSILRYIKKRVPLVRLPFQRIERVQKFYKLFKEKNNQKDQKFSEFILSLKDVEDIMGLIADAQIYFGEYESLDEVRESQDSKGYSPTKLGDCLEDKNGDSVETAVLKTLIKDRLGEYVRSLPKPKQREVISKRYGLLRYYGAPRTLKQVGEESKPKKLTRERIRQIESVSLKILKQKIEGNKGDLEMFMNRLFMYDRI